MPEKTRTHTVYKLADGTKVPSVTTVLGILSKPALIHWAWELGTQGLDYRAVRHQAADVGTLAHYLIMCYLKGEEPDTSEYSQKDIDQAENCLIKYWDWLKGHDIEPILVEEPLVSEQYRYGGTIDCLARCNRELWLIDHKTGPAIYPEMFYQLAAYKQLLQETGYEVNDCRILRIGRDEIGDFEERIAPNLDTAWEIFLRCLDIYTLQKKMRKED